MTTPPLAKFGSNPVLFGALGAVFHLELLEPEDEPRLDEANAIALDWLGPRMAFTWSSSWNDIEPFRPRDLEYAACYPRSLAAPVVPGPPENAIMAANIVKASHAQHQVIVGGGAAPDEGSPFQYRFWAEIPEVDGSDRYRAYAVLQITVPDTWDLRDFYTRVTSIARCLRLRWGAAGFTYAMWEVMDHETPYSGVYAHARRFFGFDVADYIHTAMAWYRRIRTVSWLTFLGPALGDELATVRGPLVSSSLVDVSRVGDTTLLRAGPAPEPGDRNRMRVPPAYIEADMMVRPIRARDGMDFGGPWSEVTTRDWLCRFEGWRR